MPETATTWNDIERWEIKQHVRLHGMSVQARERERTAGRCANCGGEIIPGEFEVPVKGRSLHWHCAEDLGVEVR